MRSEMAHRRSDGRRLGQAGLAGRIAQVIKGMMLAEAFVVARAGGCRLVVNKLDGVHHGCMVPGRGSMIHVDVVMGIVNRSWAPPT